MHWLLNDEKKIEEILENALQAAGQYGIIRIIACALDEMPPNERYGVQKTRKYLIIGI